MSWDIESFRQKVEDQHSFPGFYSFKFIVPVDRKEDILSILPESEVTMKESSAGSYVSITSKAFLENSQTVLDVYIEANQVEGCIAL